MIQRLLALFAVSIGLAQATAQTTTRVSLDSSGAQASNDSYHCMISADGRYVVFESWAADLVANDTNGWNDVFVRDRVTGQTLCVSVDAAGVPGDNGSGSPSISADGRFVAFESSATNLVAGDTNGTDDVFVRDLVAGTTVRASVDSAGVQGNQFSREATISGNGSRVAFSSFASNLVPGDTNSQIDVFVHDFTSGQTLRADVNNAGAQSVGGARFPVLSANGEFVAFVSGAPDLVAGDSNQVVDGFVRDLVNNTTLRISVNSAGVQANQATDWTLAISDDGEFVAFASAATNLTASDTNGNLDMFVHDPLTGQTSCVSLDAAGVPVGGYSSRPALGGNGRFVAFESFASNLVAGDTNNTYDVFVRDTLLGRTTRLSVDSLGAQANGASDFMISVSGDGRYVAFDSRASNLVGGDTNGFYDVFVRDLGTLATTAFCVGDGTQATACPCANSGASGRGCQNSAGTGGGLLSLSGFTESDSVLLQAEFVLPSSLVVFLQGNAVQNPALAFGDGVRCVGGALKRLYSKNALGGSALAPALGDLPLGARSALLGDPLAPGTSRWYQAYYRDPSASFCAAPAGNVWNVTSGVQVDW